MATSWLVEALQELLSCGEGQYDTLFVDARSVPARSSFVILFVVGLDVMADFLVCQLSIAQNVLVFDCTLVSPVRVSVWSASCLLFLAIDFVMVYYQLIGGNTTMTDAAFLAEYFCANDVRTNVVGVPCTISGGMKNNFVVSYAPRRSMLYSSAFTPRSRYIWSGPHDSG